MEFLDIDLFAEEKQNIAAGLDELGFESADNPRVDEKRINKTSTFEGPLREPPKPAYECLFQRKPRGKEPVLEASVEKYVAGIVFIINAKPYAQDWHYDASTLQPGQVIERARAYMQGKNLA